MTAIKNQNGSPFPECTVISWFVEISLALQYIHYNNILHRDLKCKNIFLTKNSVIKVGDFGIARILESPDDLATTKIGTPFYLSPEICNRQPYNCKSDMWALGCILFEMSALEKPFEAQNFRQLITSILEEKRKDLPDWSGAEVRELVDDLLQLDPIQRPSADEILEKPYLQPYLMFNRTRIPYLVRSKYSNVERYQKDSFKRSFEKNYNLEVNKTRFTSTGKLHFNPNSAKALHLDFKNTKSSSGNCNKKPNPLNLKKDNQCPTPLSETFVVSRCPPIKEEFSSKIQKDSEGGIGQNKFKSTSVAKQTTSVTELICEKYDQKSLNKKLDVKVSNETNFSTRSPTTSASKSSCQHSQCHLCMIDMLWKNRIQGCQITSINNEEYYELQNKLWSIFKDKFQKIYLTLLSNWNDIWDTNISSKSYTNSLTYQQVQHLPLMIQYVQLTMLKNSLTGKTS